MPITVTIEKDYEVYKEFVVFSFFKTKRYKMGKMIFPLLTLIIVLLMIFNIFYFDTISFLLESIMLMFLILFDYLLFLAPKLNYKKLPEMFKVPQIFTMSDIFFEVRQASDSSSGYSKIKYSELVKVYEIESAFYLFIHPVQALPIPKKNLTAEQCVAIQQLLRANMEPKKYKLCYKNKSTDRGR